jgi:hypothetical protein
MRLQTRGDVRGSHLPSTAAAIERLFAGTDEVTGDDQKRLPSKPRLLARVSFFCLLLTAYILPQVLIQKIQGPLPG